MSVVPHGLAVMNHLQEFFEWVERSDPFLANRVSDPAGAEVDVASIHDRPFHDLIAYAEQAHRQRAGIGVVVWGEAGIGKSHLLARLCRWAGQGDRAVYVFLHNLQASPAHMPRYVLKCVMSRLTEGRTRRFYDTPLCQVITDTIPEPLSLSGPLPTPADAGAALLRFAQQLTTGHPHAGPDAQQIAEIFFRFYLSAYCGRREAGAERSASLALRWLSGDGLDRDEAAKLGMMHLADPTGITALADNQAVESVLVALAELAWHSGRPMVLCFDQVDNLTGGQLEALTQFLHTLIDHCRNLLVVTSGVQSKLLDLVEQGTILRAAWERIAQDELRLHRIGVDQARQLLEARLEPLLDPWVTLPEVRERLQDDSLFPLGRQWLTERTDGLADLRPRDVINWARHRWRQQQGLLQTQGGKPWLENWPHEARHAAGLVPGRSAEPDSDSMARHIDARVARRIDEQIAGRQRDSSSLPPDADNLAGLIEMLLNQCIGREDCAVQYVQRVEPSQARRQPAYHLLIGTRLENGLDVQTAVTCLVTENATSTTKALGRMVEDRDPPHRVLLVTEDRQPLKLGPQGREHLDRLESRGERFEHLTLSFREYAELDALQAAVEDARSGDLEVELSGGRCRPLGEDEVIASLHRQECYRRHRLLGKLLLNDQQHL